jgi:hypothetical protein
MKNFSGGIEEIAVRGKASGEEEIFDRKEDSFPNNDEISREIADIFAAVESRPVGREEAEAAKNKNQAPARKAEEGFSKSSIKGGNPDNFSQADLRAMRHIDEDEAARAARRRENKISADEKMAISALAGNPDKKTIEYFLDAPAVGPEQGGERKNKVKDFFKKAGTALRNPEVQLQLFKMGNSVAASVLGYKSFYDVPAYFKQRYAVRGNVLGIGRGKGLAGSVEGLIEASQLHKKAKDNNKFTFNEKGEKELANKGSVLEAIDDLNKRLAQTKEGSAKHSEQRKLLARLLWENRQTERQTAAERKKELENILDNYTNTKVTGMQAAREALNTACMASGAVAARGAVYGGLAFFEKWEELRHKAKREADKKGPEAEVEKIGVAKVFATGVKETYDGLRFKNGRNWKEKAFGAIRSFGSVARLTGIVLGMSTSGHVYAADANKLIDFFEGKQGVAQAGHNFVNNAERYLHLASNLKKAAGAVLLPGAAQAAEHELPNYYNHQTVYPGSKAVNLTGTENVESAGVQNHPAAPIIEKIPKVDYQGGRSVWGELEKQLSARFGQDFSRLSQSTQQESIKLLVDRITADPEAFGLPKNIDFTKLSAERLQAIPWDKFFANPESHSDAINSLSETLRHPGEKLVPFGGSSAEADFPGHSIDYADQKGMTSLFKKWSELARRFYDPAVGQNDKAKVFAALTRAQEEIKAGTGAKSVSFNLNGDIKIFKDGQSFDLFQSDEPAPVKITLAAGSEAVEIASQPPAVENLPKVPAAPVPPPAALIETAAASQPAEAVAGNGAAPESALPPAENIPHRIEAIDWHHPQNIRGFFDDIGAAQHLAEQGGTLDLRHVTTISPDVLQALFSKTKGVINLTGLQAGSINNEVYRGLASLHNKGGLLLNDAALQRMEDFDRAANTSATDWAETGNNQGASQEVSAKAAAVSSPLAENAHQGGTTTGTFGVSREMKPFSLELNDNYSAVERETINKFLNSEVKGRNELVKLLKEYQDKYGDRPRFASFRRLMEYKIVSANDRIDKVLNGVGSGQKYDESSFPRVRLGGEAAMANEEAKALSLQTKLLDRGELANSDAFIGKEHEQPLSPAREPAAPSADHPATIPAAETSSVPPEPLPESSALENAVELRRFASGLYEKFGDADWTKLLEAGAARKILDDASAQNSVMKTVALIKYGIEEMSGTKDPQELASIREGIKNLIDVTEKQYGDAAGGKSIFSEPIRRLAGIS